LTEDQISYKIAVYLIHNFYMPHSTEQDSTGTDRLLYSTAENIKRDQAKGELITPELLKTMFSFVDYERALDTLITLHRKKVLDMPLNEFAELVNKLAEIEAKSVTAKIQEKRRNLKNLAAKEINEATEKIQKKRISIIRTFNDIGLQSNI
jgi:hypothetical protein